MICRVNVFVCIVHSTRICMYVLYCTYSTLHSSIVFILFYFFFYHTVGSRRKSIYLIRGTSKSWALTGRNMIDFLLVIFFLLGSVDPIINKVVVTQPQYVGMSVLVYISTYIRSTYVWSMYMYSTYIQYQYMTFTNQSRYPSTYLHMYLTHQIMVQPLFA